MLYTQGVLLQSKKRVRESLGEHKALLLQQSLTVQGTRCRVLVPVTIPNRLLGNSAVTRSLQHGQPCLQFKHIPELVCRATITPQLLLRARRRSGRSHLAYWKLNKASLQDESAVLTSRSPPAAQLP